MRRAARPAQAKARNGKVPVEHTPGGDFFYAGGPTTTKGTGTFVVVLVG